MPVLLAGVNHKTCPVSLRERLSALGAPAAQKSLLEQGWKEAVVLSTCNRFEIYAVALGAADRAFMRGNVTEPSREEMPPPYSVRMRPASKVLGAAPLDPLECLASWLDEFLGERVSTFAYRLQGPEAARHLFSVSSGLDSLVLGEGEILGQVKQAYEAAVAAKAAGKITHVLFQRSLFVGKSVRSQTAIGMGQVSVASAAVELAKRIFGRLSASEVLILGAGEMAEKAARHLLSAKVARLYVANRTWERARQLATSLTAQGGGVPDVQAVSWEEFPRFLSRADIVVASTGADKPVLSLRHAAAALAERRGRSLFLIDIAMPRAVAEDVANLDGVYLYTMDNLEAIVSENASRRAGELESAREIVCREAAAFSAWLVSEKEGRKASLRHNTSPQTPCIEAADRALSRGSAASNRPWKAAVPKAFPS